eukprot:273571-Pelagomonas_calceolata.AAC.3
MLVLAAAWLLVHVYECHGHRAKYVSALQTTASFNKWYTAPTVLLPLTSLEMHAHDFIGDTGIGCSLFRTIVQGYIIYDPVNSLELPIACVRVCVCVCCVFVYGVHA